MLSSLMITYYLIKTAYLFSLVRILVKFEVIQRNFIFLAVLYTTGIGFLSFIFVLSWQFNPTILRAWEIWLAETFGLAILYFWMLGKFDEGLIFWVILLGGSAGLIWF